jgi:two-component system, NtrC family, sensor kinase
MCARSMKPYGQAIIFYLFYDTMSLMKRKLLDSLATKLICTVGALMVIGSLIIGYIFLRYEENMMIRGLINYASTTAELVKRSVYYGMLSAHREVIEQTTRFFGEGAEIKSITIFDKKGKIIYSSRKEEVGKAVEKDYVTCKVCHQGGGKPLEAIPESKNWMLLPEGSGSKTLKFITPLYNQPSCASASCHYHPQTKRILGMLETSFSADTVDAAVRQHRFVIILFDVLVLILISVSLFIILYKFVLKPISLLNEGMQKLTTGENFRIEIHSNDEMGMLARAFNSMAQEIKQYKEKMENWTSSLEDEVKKKTAEILKAQEQFINTEKLASLGRMAAGVAHELNSPLTGIVTFAHLILKSTPPENKQEIEDLEVIIDQANRCSKIIKGLLGFSRRTSSEKVLVNINQLTESTISMVRNQAKFHNIEFKLNFDSNLPQVSVDPNQIQQVFLNLLLNAADAVNERGKVTVATRVLNDSYVEIEFTDNGPGIAEEHLGKIFEPFFTTKPLGKGTGLGLAVSYGIIKKHNGTIFAKSEVGKGASFFVRLPLEVKIGRIELQHV